MTSFTCEQCKARILYQYGKQLTGCEHHPIDGQKTSETGKPRTKRKNGRPARKTNKIRRRLVVRIGTGDWFLSIKEGCHPSKAKFIPARKGIDNATVFIYMKSAEKNAKMFGGKVEELSPFS